MNKRKVFVWFLFLLFLIPSPVFAQGDSPTPPAPTGGNVVLDTLDWLTPSQESEINAINKRLDEEGIAQIAVVTLNDCGDDKQKFRNDLFRTWGIGHANDNDGLLILVCWYGGDKSRRSIEQETGYGLEGTLPDVLTGRVVDDEFIPAFQANQPGNGLVAMVTKYDSILRKDIEATTIPLDKRFVFLIIGFLGIAPGMILAMTYSRVLQTGNQNETMQVTSAITEDKPENLSSPLYQFALAEIISLIPLLGILYLGLKGAFTVPPSILLYGRFIFPYLLVWLVMLVLFYVSKFFRKRTEKDIFEPRNDSLEPKREGTDISKELLDVASDIVHSLPSFGDGDSGGGGSSKKF